MNRAPRILLATSLAGVGIVLAFVFLWHDCWGEIEIFALSKKGPGLCIPMEIPGFLLGVIAPLCLFAGAAFVARDTKARE